MRTLNKLPSEFANWTLFCQENKIDFDKMESNIKRILYPVVDNNNFLLPIRFYKVNIGFLKKKLKEEVGQMS